jgi:hypothetical protein
MNLTLSLVVFVMHVFPVQGRARGSMAVSILQKYLYPHTAMEQRST